MENTKPPADAGGFDYLHLYEPFVFRPAGIDVLQLMLVEQIPRVVEVLGPGGAFFDAGAALDADAIDLGHVRRVDTSHGTPGST